MPYEFFFYSTLDKNQTNQWDNFVNNCLSGTPYQMTFFHECYRNVNPHFKSLGYCIGYKNNKIVFVGFGYINDQYTTSGRNIIEFPHGPAFESYQDLYEGLAFLKERFAHQYIININPYMLYDKDVHQEIINLNYFEQEKSWFGTTIRIDLDQDEESIFLSLSSKTRQDIRKSLKNNHYVSIRKDVQSVDLFVKLHNTLAIEKGFSCVEREYVKNVICNDSIKSQAALFFMHDANSEILAAILIIYTKNLAWYQRGASIKNRQVNAQYLSWFAIKWARENHISYYDFGGIRPNENCSVTRFKRGFNRKGDVLMLPSYQLNKL